MNKPIEITSRIASIISEEDDRSLALQLVCKYLAKGLKADIVSIYLNDKASYRLIANYGFQEAHIGKLQIPKGMGLVNHIISTRRALCLREATSHRAFYYIKGLGEEKFHGFTGVPVMKKRNISGALIVQYKKEHDCTLEEIALLETIAQQISHLMPSATKGRVKEEKKKAHLRGRGMVPGLFKGHVISHLLVEDTLATSTEPDGLGYEIEKSRLDKARTNTLNFFTRLRDQAPTQEGKEILSSHITMLTDPLLIKKEDHFLKNKHSAEQAVTMAVREIAKAFEDISDPYIRQRSIDVLDVGKRLYHNLTQSELGGSIEDHAAVWIASHPSPTALIERGKKAFGALILIDESLYSHIIILAKSMGIPTVILSRDQLADLQKAEEVLVDGERGTILLEPSDLLVRNYFDSHALINDKTLLELGECRTKDGKLLKLEMNAAFPQEVSDLPPWVNGIGLFRTEFQYFLKPDLPTEQEQEKDFIEIFENVGRKPVTMRILDVGGDKCPPSMHFLHEENPILGERSIRFLLKRNDLFISQLRAMLSAQSQCKGKLRVLIPMVTIYEEVSRIRDHLIKVIRDFNREGQRLRIPPLGVMIEIPSCVALIPKLARVADFFCVGTNDLLQYFMGADRNNNNVSHIYQWNHPSFLMILHEVAQKCLDAGREVTICGEMAGEYWGSLVLMGLGFEKLSMDKKALGRHHQLISHTSLSSLQKLTKKLIQCETRVEILEKLQIYLDSWNQLPNEQRELLQNELDEMLQPSK